MAREARRPRLDETLRVSGLLFTIAWGTNHFAPLLLVYRARLGLSPVDLAALFAIYAIGLVPGLLAGGPLSDRRGRRAVVLPAAFLALGGTALLAAGAAGFGFLMAGRLIVGIGSGGVFSAGTAWLQDLSASHPGGTGARRTTVALSCGFGGGPLVAGLVAQWCPGPMLVPYLLQATALSVAIALAWSAPAVARRPNPEPTSADRGPSLGFPPRFLREVGLVAPWVFAFPSIAFVVLPALVRAHVAGFSVAYAGLVAAVTLGSGILIQPVLRLRQPRHAAVAGLLLGTVGLLIGWLATSRGSPVVVVLAAVLLGGGYGACLIAGLRSVETTTPAASRGRVTAVFYVLTYLGFAAPLLMATVARRTSDGTPLLLTAASAVVTALGTGLQRWRSDRRGLASARSPGPEVTTTTS